MEIKPESADAAQASAAAAPDLDTSAVIAALAALAQENRLAIFRLLVETGPGGLPVGRIGEALGLAPATLSFHLKELARAGLVATQPQGRQILCSADFSTMNALLAYLTQNCCRGEAECLPQSLCCP